MFCSICSFFLKKNEGEANRPMLYVYIDSLWYHSMICMLFFSVGGLRAGYRGGKSSKRFTVRALVSVGTAIGFWAVGTAIGFGVFLVCVFLVRAILLSLLPPSAFHLPRFFCPPCVWILCILKHVSHSRRTLCFPLGPPLVRRLCFRHKPVQQV